MTHKKLNIGILIDGPNELCVWQSRILDQLQESGFSELKLVIVTNRKRYDHKLSYLYCVYQNLEKKRWSGVEDLTRLENEPQSLRVVEVLGLEKATMDNLQDRSLDVVLNFTQHNAPDELQDCANTGVWTWQFGDGLNYRQQQPTGFWEVYTKSPTMGATLSVSLCGSIKNKVLHHTIFAADDRSSAFLNQKQACLVAQDKTILMLKKLAELGRDSFFQQVTKSLSSEAPDPSGKLVPPGNLLMLSFFTRKVFNSIKMRLMHTFFSEEWTMRYKLEEKGQGISEDYQSFKTLAPAQGGLWADPFIVFKDDRYYLFYEDAITDLENADISYVSIDQAGTMSEPKTILVKPYHLSYPFVFFWEGDYYMMPETKGNRTIEVYKASQFPDQWEFHCNLMEDVEAVDTTLHFFEGKWWMFTSIKPCKGVSINNEMSIFYADSPLSQEWTPHPMNPVLSDVRRARPAGRIYEEGNKLLRPSQDASVRYGYGFRINEIVTLTETEYKEREIGFTEPNWAGLLTGTHTLAHEKDLTVIDVLEWRLKYFG